HLSVRHNLNPTLTLRILFYYRPGINTATSDFQHSKHPRPRRRRTRRGQSGRGSPQNYTGSSTPPPELIPIYNLSDRPLTDVENRILSRGLSFIRTSRLYPFTWEIEQFAFSRSLRLCDFFKTQVNDAQVVNNATSPFRLRSTFDPPATQASIKTFSRIVHADSERIFSNTYKSAHSPSNISGAERLALKDLATDHSITIRPADKGVGIVILRYSDYCNEILSQLSDSDTYAKCDSDPTMRFFNTIRETLETALDNGTISESLFSYLLVKNAKTPILYTLPKIHKNPLAPPGRPIVSAKFGLLEPLGKFLDSILKGPVMALHTCIRDSPEVLSTIQSITLSPDTLLATLNVKSLYTVIPHEAGIEAVR
uniref:Uncharacterized protein n=1 Tax=Leptobrachium leishanense TaxID=445787 RepID=A0A8C5QJH6_9ANUR